MYWSYSASRKTQLVETQVIITILDLKYITKVIQYNQEYIGKVIRIDKPNNYMYML